MTASSETGALESTVKEALREVADPCSIAAGEPISVVDLGLVSRVGTPTPETLHIEICLTQPGCWFFADICRRIEHTLRERLSYPEVVVTIDRKNIWTPDRVEAGRDADPGFTR